MSDYRPEPVTDERAEQLARDAAEELNKYGSTMHCGDEARLREVLDLASALIEERKKKTCDCGAPMKLACTGHCENDE